ncbi:putative uncharacterized protein DDB_G0277255 [Leptopilina heterotoma]|uniref:putative uncharacterized protein DDB_G0277255 n=1 Tax=Leptopilina heterotoma TaxID=63436 RepID=UPI001CA8CE12|nr:putative uncharacterized protein DDB_G0277255 [Leptopilina heterotoma]XP_043467076.1 putative uncharacterized protein DDB_G0277255 [Leptopilina heterotoma]
MDLTEAFTPGGGGSGVVVTEDMEKTDFFDFVVSPQSLSSAQGTQSVPPHCTSIETNEESILRQTQNCRALDFLHNRQLGMEDTERVLPFIKETNNNTLTALPPVSTITSSLSQHSRNNNCDNNDHISMEHSDCDYWSAVGDNKDSACNILLEDLNKYCWSTHHTDCHHSLVGQSADASIDLHQQVNDSVSTACSDNGRQNTDGAIYTLTVLNNETDSMDALDCCKSPVPTVSDTWSLRPNLDLDAILSLEPATTEQQDHERIGIDSSGNSFHTSNHPSTHYSTDDGNFVDSKELPRLQPNPLGDNNNDWKLSDQNHLNESTVATATVSAVVSDSAESLLRSALQGKLYTTCSSAPVLVSSSSTSQANSTISLTASSTGSTLQLIADQHLHQHQQQDHLEEEVINTDEDLILSHLDTPTYRPGEYEKLKNIANEVVESYCSLEPVCNVAATTVMYTLDPSSGSLGTITLPADLSQVGTVTVVTASSLAAQQEILQQAVSTRSDISESIQQQVTSNQITNARVTTSGSTSSTTKSGKKYCRRKNNSTNNSNTGAANASSSSSLLSSNNSINSSSGNSNNNSNQQQSGQPSGSPSSVQRKERSLHYCSICSKGFKDKYSVNVHIRTHTGEKPFACSLCGKSFRQKAHLAKHYQTHVAQKPNVANANNNNASTSTTSNSNNNSNSNSSSCSNNNNSSNNNSSADLSTGRTQPQLVTTIAASCNPTCN